MGSSLAAVLMLLPLMAAGGCATVSPWEREILARPDMVIGSEPVVDRAEAHHADTREGSSGALGTSGGGCGCN